MSNKIKISCKEASFLISKKQETNLSFYEKIQLKLHLMICDVCKLFKKQTQLILLLLQSKPTEKNILHPDSKKRINEALQKEVSL